MRSILVFSALLPLLLIGCATHQPIASAAVQQTVPIAQASPVGIFYGPDPFVRLRLNSDGTYAIDTSSAIRPWPMIEGKRVYIQRTPFAPEKGNWVWDHKTGQLTLTIHTPYSSRGKVQPLQFYKTNPDVVVWNGEPFKRQSSGSLFFLNSTEF
jgi:hypothetical protein